jgi:integrase
VLTEKFVRREIKRLEGGSSMRRLSDGKWLTLLVTPDGSSRWQQRYRFGGKERTISLGTYPSVSIADARERAGAARKLIQQNIDPVEDRRSKRAQLRLEVENTFAVATEAWFQFNLPRWKLPTVKKVRQYLDKDLLPGLGKKPLNKISTLDITSIIKKMELRDAFNAAKKVRQWVKGIFAFAIANGWVTENPTQYLDAITTPTPTGKNYAHLTLAELPALLQKMEAFGGEFTKAAIWLALWTANRPGVTRTVRWSEIDLDAGLWTIDKGREGMKLGYAHTVPLPLQGVAMLRRLHRTSGAGPFVFVSRSHPNQPLSDAAVNKALATMGFKGRQTAHGFRHLVSTALNEMGFEKDWIERQLAHGDPDKIRGTYNKALYLPQRRQMMQAWADRLQNMANVSEFNSHRRE